MWDWIWFDMFFKFALVGESKEITVNPYRQWIYLILLTKYDFIRGQFSEIIHSNTFETFFIRYGYYKSKVLISSYGLVRFKHLSSWEFSKL